jgi:Protein of unknown function (DUF835)
VRLEQGIGYLVRSSSDATVEIIHAFRPPRTPLLWITSGPGARPPEDVEVLRVASLPGAMRTVQPGRLGDMQAAAGAFLDEHSGGCIVLDAMDALVVHNGVERVVRAIESMHEDVATRGGLLLVCVNPVGANPRLLAWLERELDEALDLAALAAAPSP